jgi:hypothetical protein
MNFVTDETMSSHQLAALTGKKPSEIFWDVNAMLDELPHPEMEDGVTFVNIATKRGEVRLSKLMTYRLIMRYTQGQQDIIRFAWDDIEIPLTPLAQSMSAVGGKPVLNPSRRRAQKAPL